MIDLLKAVSTRFRAYQLGQVGSSFGDRFTLIEAMATETSRPSLRSELEICDRQEIDTLHITSWDADHCSELGLAWILENLRPAKIEYPGYEPHTDSARACSRAIQAYRNKPVVAGRSITTQRIDPDYIRNLNAAEGLGYREIFYHPKSIFEKSNDNSTVKFFRSGMFNVISLGDIESPNIGSLLRSCRILCQEADIMILAHHGADSGVTTKKFLNHINPLVAICTSNYDNQYSHPAQGIRDLLHEEEIPLYTTKTGDVIVRSIDPHRMHFQVINLQANSTEISSHKTFVSRKSRLLSGNQDAIRNRYHPGFKGIKK